MKPSAPKAPAPTAAAPKQADHPVEVRLGGRRSNRLRVVEPMQLPAEWEIRPGVPRTRGECSGAPRPCPYVSCRHHLWLRLQQDQPGNPRRGRQGETTIRAHSMQSCALDVAEQHATAQQIADHLGCDVTRIRQITQRGLEKLRYIGEQSGSSEILDDVERMLEAL